MRMSIGLMLVACHGPVSNSYEDLPESIAPPPGSQQIELNGRTIVERLETVTWQVTGPELAPNVPVSLAWGGGLVSGRCPHRQLVGGTLCLDIGSPINLVRTVTSIEHPDYPGQGLAEYTLTVPRTARDHVYLQAMSIDGPNSSTTQPQRIDLVWPPPVRTSPNCGSILIYTTEDRDDRANYLGRFDGLPTDPALTDYTITVRERIDFPTLLGPDVAGFDQLWVMGTNRDRREIFSAAEVATIHQFLADGGGLLVASDHGVGTYTYTEDVNIIAEHYGAEFVGDHSPGSISVFTDPELSAGVSSIVGHSESWVVLDDSTLTPAAFANGQVAVAKGSDAQRIVLDSAWPRYDSAQMDILDTRQYVQNVADYLGRCQR